MAPGPVRCGWACTPVPFYAARYLVAYQNHPWKRRIRRARPRNQSRSSQLVASRPLYAPWNRPFNSIVVPLPRGFEGCQRGTGSRIERWRDFTCFTVKWRHLYFGAEKFGDSVINASQGFIAFENINWKFAKYILKTVWIKYTNITRTFHKYVKLWYFWILMNVNGAYIYIHNGALSMQRSREVQREFSLQ